MKGSGGNCSHSSGLVKPCIKSIAYRRSTTMSRQKKKTDDMQRESYFTKMIEKAENAMREYQQERGGEHCLFVTEYARRKGFLLEQ